MVDLALSDIRLLAAIAEAGSFRAAALRLDLPPSTLSRQVALLERRLGVRLFNRTTRSVALTEGGAAFLGRAMPALREIEVAVGQMGALRSEPGGRLRINGSEPGLTLLLPVVARFLGKYPKVEVDLVEDGHFTDIVAQGFDAGIRLAEDVPRDMIAVPLGPDQRFIVVGAPSYLKARAPLLHPSDLAHHACIRARMPSGRIIQWEFDRGGEVLTAAVSGSLIVGTSELSRQAALLGGGLAYLTEMSVSADMAAGRLIQVLGGWCPAFPGLRLYYPRQKAPSVTLRVFVDDLRKMAAEARR